MTIWEGYNQYVYKLHLILDNASRVGIPVNDEKRLKLKDDLEKLIINIENGWKDEEGLWHDGFAQLIPIEIRDLHPRRKLDNGEIEFGFKRIPKEITKLIGDYNYSIHILHLRNPNAKIISLDKFIFNKTGMILTLGGLWAKVKPFKPSSKQILKYLHWKIKTSELKKTAKLYKIPINFKTKKETTGKKELEELVKRTQDEVLKNVQEYRSIKYNLTNSVPNWKPDANGYTHTTWGFTAPTGQLDSRNPNILNCSKHTNVGKVFRGIVETPEGYCFVEFDYKSFHVALMGFEANDPNYIRFSQLDPHSIYCSHLIEGDKNVVPLIPRLATSSDSDILEICKYIKSKYKEVRQNEAKPTVLGNQLGLGPYKLQHQNRKYITSIDRARELQAILAKEFPLVERAKREIRDKAHTQGYLINEFGRIQYFYDVYNYQWNKQFGKWEKKHGGDSEKCLGFAVQSPAFGMIHSKLLELEEEGYLRKFNFNNSIHDQVAFMPTMRDRDKCLEVVYKKLTEPCKYLVNEATGSEGLRVGVEAFTGRNWQDRSKENPEGMEEVKI